MTQWLTLWWHRRVLGHLQQIVMNGATEPGVECYCNPYCWVCGGDQRYWRCYHPRRYRWFPSDGGRGR